MRTCVLVLAAVLGFAAAPAARPAEAPPLAHARLGVANGCFVESVAFLDHWQQVHGDAWARLLQWGVQAEEETVAGHAVAICEAHGGLWCWDINYGWSRLPVAAAQRDQVEVVAAPVLGKYPKVTARYPTYRHDFHQETGTPPQAGDAALANPALRDAVLVGTELARRRPVNVVRFVYGLGGERRDSAAVVFVFHGRYCIYVPERGTVPFRVHTGVENLRVIQELLRRMCAGATDVRKV